MRAIASWIAMLAASFASAEDADELAKQLSNPIASLKSVRSLESTCDWERSQWNAPLHVGVGQVLSIGRRLISLQAGGAW